MDDFHLSTHHLLNRFTLLKILLIPQDDFKIIFDEFIIYEIQIAKIWRRPKSRNCEENFLEFHIVFISNSKGDKAAVKPVKIAN